MTSNGPPPSNFPPSMGPGARPVQPGEGGPRRTGLAELIKIRSKYAVSAESEILQLGYELNDQPRLYRLPYESLPLGSFSKWLLYGGPKRARTTGSQVLDILRRVEAVRHEPVSQREAEGIAYHLSRASLYRLTGDVVACGLAGVIAWRNREKMKFPFLSAKPLQRYDIFPSTYMPLVQGRYAHILWHMVRVNMWAGLFIIGLTPIFSSMGNFLAMRGIYTDDRTHHLVEALKDQLRAVKEETGQPGSVQRRPPPRQEAQTEGQYGTSGNQEYYEDKAGGVPDAPLTSDYSWRAESSQSQWTSAGTLYPDNPMSARQTQRDPEPYRDDRSFGADPIFGDDDASPVAADAPDRAGTSQDRQARGSSWARIRSGNRPTNISQRGGESEPQAGAAQESSDWWRNRESSTQGLGQTTQKMSQKEFDEMLERERRLSGSDEYNSGMRAVESAQDTGAATDSSSGTSAWGGRRDW
ncbi:hypothetical protein ABEF95_005560 [Exophiala dermatitidis]